MGDFGSHRINFTVENNKIYLETFECLAEAGNPCREGCPVENCYDWEHGGGNGDGCVHCTDMCDCDIDDELRRCPQVHEGECPHVYQDLGRCWLLPFLVECDCMYPDIQDHLDRPASDQLEYWTIVFHEWDGEASDFHYWLTRPDQAERVVLP